MVTPHLPPHQAANALLPHLLAQGLRPGGDEVRFLTFGAGPGTSEVSYVKRRGQRLRATRLPQVLEALETTLKSRPLVRWADVVHVHSNTWMNQLTARAAVRAGRPYVLTHYGTEIWHHDGRDPVFRKLNSEARHVAFYSQALLARGRELGVPLKAASVIYPPVAEVFTPRSDAERTDLRLRLWPGSGPLMLNVKRLHPLADQKTLLEAFALVRRERADVRLAVAGTGECGPELEQRAQALELGAAVRFLGLVPNERVAEWQAAADLFALSSTLEATPTVALEALASGTRVVSTDNPGGVELQGLFGDDVVVVPKQAPAELAQAALVALSQGGRVALATRQRIASSFRLPGVVAQYRALYTQARET